MRWGNAGDPRAAAPVAATLRTYTSLAALGATAAFQLAWYRARTRLHGPSLPDALRRLQQWSRGTWKRLRLDVVVHGQPAAEPCVYVCNHRSYLDIPLLAGTLGATFISRADVATWPIVGAAARAAGVVFVDRNSLPARARAARSLARRLRTTSVIVFPEGTTNGARLPRPFNPGLFRLVHRLGASIVPMTIRYSDRRAYWVDDVSLSAHLRTSVLSGPRLCGVVHIGTRLRPQAYLDAEALTQATRQAICQPIEAFGEVVGEPLDAAASGAL